MNCASRERDLPRSSQGRSVLRKSTKRDLQQGNLCIEFLAVGEFQCGAGEKSCEEGAGPLVIRGEGRGRKAVSFAPPSLFFQVFPGGDAANAEQRRKELRPHPCRLVGQCRRQSSSSPVAEEKEEEASSFARSSYQGSLSLPPSSIHTPHILLFLFRHVRAVPHIHSPPENFSRAAAAAAAAAGSNRPSAVPSSSFPHPSSHSPPNPLLIASHLPPFLRSNGPSLPLPLPPPPLLTCQPTWLQAVRFLRTKSFHLSAYRETEGSGGFLLQKRLKFHVPGGGTTYWQLNTRNTTTAILRGNIRNFRTRMQYIPTSLLPLESPLFPHSLPE